MCADAGSLTLVVGVAGSGKTTALDAAAAALRHAGRQVIGVSTSGQAARTLSSEAHIPASTFASLAHRLGRGTEPLGPDTVVIVDEAGMADDADLARLFLAAERTGARLVLVGDDRQLPAVGPGGGFAALLARHPGRVVTLDANVRQHDIDERLALAALRNGNPALPIDWYQGNDRIRTSASRTDTLIAAASAWAADVVGGRDTVLLAWRRADVTDLNRLARDRWDQLGRLHGPDITVANGRTYAVGDRVVATAPNHPAGIVTSERLTITDLSQHHIDAVNENGAAVHITGFGLDHEHLDHGYAVTIHRAQGVTADIAHVVADGGSRELAYVALSRARERSTIHLTAPDAADAAELLTEAWTSSHVEPWIIDTAAKVGIQPKPSYAEREEDVAALLEQLRTYEPSVAASSPPLDLGIDFW